MFSDSRMLRLADFKDIEELANVYRKSILEIGKEKYDHSQVAAWASFADDLAEFSSLIFKGYTILAEVSGIIASFGQLYPDDHVSLIYTLPGYNRRGIASDVYMELEIIAKGKGVDKLHTEASLIARPFFSKHGFKVIEKEVKIWKSAEFVRFRMEKYLH